MATKTISVSIEAYERLAEARSTARESFSKVICRAKWPVKEGTAADLLRRSRERDSDADVALLDANQKADLPPSDPWDN